MLIGQALRDLFRKCVTVPCDWRIANRSRPSVRDGLSEHGTLRLGVLSEVTGAQAVNAAAKAQIRIVVRNMGDLALGMIVTGRWGRTG